MLVALAGASAACSKGADVVVDNRCGTGIWVHPTVHDAPPPGYFDGWDPYFVVAGTKATLADAATEPPEPSPGAIAVSAAKDVVGPVVPLPYVDGVYQVVIEGPACPPPSAPEVP